MRLSKHKKQMMKENAATTPQSKEQLAELRKERKKLNMVKVIGTVDNEKVNPKKDTSARRKRRPWNIPLSKAPTCHQLKPEYRGLRKWQEK